MDPRNAVLGWVRSALHGVAHSGQCVYDDTGSFLITTRWIAMASIRDHARASVIASNAIKGGRDVYVPLDDAQHMLHLGRRDGCVVWAFCPLDIWKVGEVWGTVFARYESHLQLATPQDVCSFAANLCPDYSVMLGGHHMDGVLRWMPGVVCSRARHVVVSCDGDLHPIPLATDISLYASRAVPGCFMRCTEVALRSAATTVTSLALRVPLLCNDDICRLAGLLQRIEQPFDLALDIDDDSAVVTIDELLNALPRDVRVKSLHCVYINKHAVPASFLAMMLDPRALPGLMSVRGPFTGGTGASLQRIMASRRLRVPSVCRELVQKYRRKRDVDGAVVDCAETAQRLCADACAPPVTSERKRGAAGNALAEMLATPLPAGAMLAVAYDVTHDATLSVSGNAAAEGVRVALCDNEELTQHSNAVTLTGRTVGVRVGDDIVQVDEAVRDSVHVLSGQNCERESFLQLPADIAVGVDDVRAILALQAATPERAARLLAAATFFGARHAARFLVGGWGYIAHGRAQFEAPLE